MTAYTADVACPLYVFHSNSMPTSTLLETYDTHMHKKISNASLLSVLSAIFTTLLDVHCVGNLIPKVSYKKLPGIAGKLPLKRARYGSLARLTADKVQNWYVDTFFS